MHVYGLITDSKPAFMVFVVIMGGIVMWGVARSWGDQLRERERMRAFKDIYFGGSRALAQAPAQGYPMMLQPKRPRYEYEYEDEDQEQGYRDSRHIVYR